MRNKAKIAVAFSLIVSELLVVGTAIGQYDQIANLNKQISCYENLLKEANDTIKERSNDILQYKGQLLYYEKQLIMVNTIKEKARKVSVEETHKTVVFDANDIRIPSGATAEDLTLALKNTNLEHLASAYVALEQKYGWNAIVAASITAHETYWGNDYKFTEYNNLGGIRERSGDYWVFNSQEECVDYIGSLISRKYLNEDGEYFNGYSLKDINTMYCPVGGDTWSDSIAQIGGSLVEKIKGEEADD